jgi:hypothetical protein
MSLLNYQATIYLECNTTYPQNFGKRHLSTLSTHDFFVAGMAIALDLHYGYKSEPMTASSNDIDLWGYDRRVETITALETSNQFWKIWKDYSIEAAKAYGIFSFVLMKAKKAQWMIDAQMTDNPEVPDETTNQPEMDLFSNQIGMERVEEQHGFNWVRYIFYEGPQKSGFLGWQNLQNLWNADSADNGDFESLLNWSPKNPDNYTTPGPMVSSSFSYHQI